MHFGIVFLFYTNCLARDVLTTHNSLMFGYIMKRLLCLVMYITIKSLEIAFATRNTLWYFLWKCNYLLKVNRGEKKYVNFVLKLTLMIVKQHTWVECADSSKVTAQLKNRVKYGFLNFKTNVFVMEREYYFSIIGTREVSVQQLISRFGKCCSGERMAVSTSRRFYLLQALFVYFLLKTSDFTSFVNDQFKLHKKFTEKYESINFVADCSLLFLRRIRNHSYR